MMHELTLFEVLEIHELLVFKTTALVKSRLFLKFVKDEDQKVLLAADIDLSIKEVSNLRKMLFGTANNSF